MKIVWKWLLLIAALGQFAATALPPGNDDLISIHSLALDLSRGEDSLLYPGGGFARNDEWIAHHEANLRTLGDRGQPNWCFYPPLVPYLTIPFAAVRDDTWRLVWGALQIGFAILFALLIERLLIGIGFRPDRILVLALVFGSYPVARSVELGQTSLLVALFIWCGIYFAGTRKWLLAILLTGTAIFVKPFLGVVPLSDAIRRQWRGAVGSAAMWVLLLVISLAAVGVSAHVEYWNLLRTLGESQTAYYGNQSLLGGLLRIFSDLLVTDYGFWSSTALAWLGRTLAVLILAAAAWAQIKSRTSQPILTYGMWLSAAALALPISWEHHLVFVLPAIAMLWALPRSRSESVLLVLSTLLICVRWTYLYGDESGGRLAANLPLAGNLILFIVLILYLRKTHESATEVVTVKETDVRA